jgi:hypothetical protein
VLFPRTLLRLEGLALGAGALIVYFQGDYPAWLFVALILAPDLSFAAYAAGPRIGALGYNALHTLVGPLLVGVIGVVGDWKLGVEIALIWLAHIGVDRLMGYGLKYPTAFKDTHLQRV